MNLAEPRIATLFCVGLSIAGLLIGATRFIVRSNDASVQRRVGTTLHVNLLPSDASPAAALKMQRVIPDQPSEDMRFKENDAHHLVAATKRQSIGKHDATEVAAFAASEQAHVSTAIGVDASTAQSGSAFQRELLEHIARFRRYPDAARSERLSGVVSVRFALSRDGTVLDVWVQRSSGSQVLDEEAIETIRRAQPMPAIPANMPERLDLALPVSFALL